MNRGLVGRQAAAPDKSRRFEALVSLTLVASYSRGKAICRPGQPADRWFWIIGGMARRSVIRRDGRRRIVDLLFPGDCFGMTSGAEYDATIEALAADTYVASCARRDAERQAETNTYLAGEIRRIWFEALSRLQTHLAIVGQVTAHEKVGAFLLEMCDRLSTASGDCAVLPFSRYDTADYLGLSVETVSRSLTCLKQHDAIELSGPRSARIMNRAALARRGRATLDEFTWRPTTTLAQARPRRRAELPQN
jgi:CRP/FNR family nitrogen fixation transcriptional regulator